MKKSKKEKKPMDKNLKKSIMFVSVIIFVIILISVVLCILLDDDSNKGTKTVKKNLNEIEGYGITLDDLDSEVYKGLFDELKSNLESKNIDYDKYAESIAKMYIVDLYTISTKINKYDIGGVEFIYPRVLENYKLNVMDTLYLYVEDNSREDREQNLPYVNEVTVDSVKKDKYVDKMGTEDESDDITFDAYIFELSWTYKLKLGYDTSATIVVINDNGKLYVAEQTVE